MGPASTPAGLHRGVVALTTDELSYIVNDCGARAFITSAYKADQAAELVDTTPGVELRLMLDGAVTGYESYELTTSAQPDGHWRGASPVSTCCTLWHDWTAEGCAAGARTRAARNTRNARRSDVASALRDGRLEGLLSPAPMYHAAPLRFSMSAVSLGDGRDHGALRHRALPRVHRASPRPRHTVVVPTMFVRLLKLPDEVRLRYDVSSLECVIHAAAVPDPGQADDDRVVGSGDPRVLRRNGRQRPATATVRCGSATKARWACRSTARCTSWARTARSCRRARSEPSTSRAARSSSTTTTPRRPPVAPPRGWSTLGDIGYLDPDNYLYLTDRKAFLVITGGVNVYPQEAENVLVTHPKVVDVAVFGVPNEDFGEEVKAVVQPAEMPADDDAVISAASCRAPPRATRRRQVPAHDRLPHRAAATRPASSTT